MGQVCLVAAGVFDIRKGGTRGAFAQTVQPVINSHQSVSNLTTAVAFGENVRYCVKIPERLRHLLAIDQQMSAMEPVADEFLSRAAFSLCDFGFVVRENVVDSTAVNVDLIAQQSGGHGAALDMPAGPATAPRAFPADIPVFFVPPFPKCEISDVLLI